MVDIMKDCFAYDDKKKECRALKDLYCNCERCYFYKPKKEITWEQIEKQLRK